MTTVTEIRTAKHRGGRNLKQDHLDLWWLSHQRFMYVPVNGKHRARQVGR